MNRYELLIDTGEDLMAPMVTGDIKWTVDRFGVAGKLTFSVMNTEALHLSEGNAVAFKVNGIGVFFGFIFTLDADSRQVNIKCYDQLRYLKNKDYAVYKGLRADEIIRRAGTKFGLRMGTLTETAYVVPKLLQENQSLIDLFSDALDHTLTNTGKLYVLYDDYGKLTLRDIETMRLNLIYTSRTLGDFNLSSSIDSDTYNRVVLVDNDGKGHPFTDADTVKQWGVLQHIEKLGEGENPVAKGRNMLALMNRKSRTYKGSKLIGDLRVRGGSGIGVQIELGAERVQVYMVVENVTHTFSGGGHFMDVTLRGGA